MCELFGVFLLLCQLNFVNYEKFIVGTDFVRNMNDMCIEQEESWDKGNLFYKYYFYIYIIPKQLYDTTLYWFHYFIFFTYLYLLHNPIFPLHSPVIL